MRNGVLMECGHNNMKNQWFLIFLLNYFNRRAIERVFFLAMISRRELRPNGAQPDRIAANETATIKR